MIKDQKNLQSHIHEIHNLIESKNRSLKGRSLLAENKEDNIVRTIPNSQNIPQSILSFQSQLKEWVNPSNNSIDKLINEFEMSDIKKIQRHQTMGDNHNIQILKRK